MKSYHLLFILAALFSLNASAQKKTTAYCKLTVIYKKNEQQIFIDYGSSKNAYIKDTSVIADLIKVKTIANGMDAMNYLGSIGWQLVQVVYVPYQEYDCFYKKELGQ